MAIEQARNIDSRQHVAEASSVRGAILSEEKIREGAKHQPAKEMEVADVQLTAVHPAAKAQGMPAVSPDQIVLENVGILGHLDGLAVSAERERAADLNRRNRIVEGRRGDADIGEAESFLLIKVYELAVGRNPVRGWRIGGGKGRIGLRKITGRGGGGYRKSGRRRTTKVGYRQRLLVMTICKKEPHRHPALF